jgi:hypothetical protein
VTTRAHIQSTIPDYTLAEFKAISTSGRDPHLIPFTYAEFSAEEQERYRVLFQVDQVDAQHPIHPIFGRLIRAGKVTPLFVTLSAQDRAFVAQTEPVKNREHQQISIANYQQLSLQRPWKVAYPEEAREYPDPAPDGYVRQIMEIA